jgi:hypothetical protein
MAIETREQSKAINKKYDGHPDKAREPRSNKAPGWLMCQGLWSNWTTATLILDQPDPSPTSENQMAMAEWPRRVSSAEMGRRETEEPALAL